MERLARLSSCAVRLASRRNAACSVGLASLAFVSILWLGTLLGVSFLATPVKFTAPSLDLPTALDVGRVTFALFAKVERVLAVLLVAAALLSGSPRIPYLLCGGALVAILAVQGLWLLPVLDWRLGLVVSGMPVPPSDHHLLYIAADLAKALVLLGLSVMALRTLATAREPAPCA